MFKFFKKEKEKSKEEFVIKARTTVQRPVDEVKKLTKKDLDKLKKLNQNDKKVDPYFLQDIVDRICGPDSEEYKLAIIELNKKFKSRVGRTGRKIFE
jgi:hypothetical protein